MHKRPESEVVLSAQSGNRNAFAQLVLRYQNLITSLAFSKTGDLQRSEDIAQQAFLIAWQKRNELRDPDRFGSWLRSITRNVTFNSNRKSNRVKESETPIESGLEPSVSDPPMDLVTTREQQELLWESLKNIPEGYREPLILYYREDKSVSQVAELMGLSVDAVKQRLKRGRAMLKAEVEQFVEDLLGTTRASASFSTAVLAALPAAASVAGSVAGKAVVKTGAAMGAKTMLGKLGILISGPFLGAMGGVLGAGLGVAGAWYGTKTAEKHATSEEEKILLWWFFRTILILTGLFTFVSIATAFLSTQGLGRLIFVIGTSIIYTIILIGLIISFINRQKALHDKFGQPAYLNETQSYQKPATPEGYRFAIIGATCGMWAWLLVLAIVKLEWIVFGIALTLMLGHGAWRIVTSNRFVTTVSQMRNQATIGLINAVLAALVVTLADLFGSDLSYDSVPGWGMGVFVILLGVGISLAIRLGANSIEKKAKIDNKSKQ